MLIPDKYTSFKTSVISVAAEVIKILKLNRKLRYNKVLELVINQLGDASKYEFQSALNFLFLLGKINYNFETDSLEIDYEIE